MFFELEWILPDASLELLTSVQGDRNFLPSLLPPSLSFSSPTVSLPSTFFFFLSLSFLFPSLPSFFHFCFSLLLSSLFPFIFLVSVFAPYFPSVPPFLKLFLPSFLLSCLLAFFSPFCSFSLCFYPSCFSWKKFCLSHLRLSLCFFLVSLFLSS